ncbi:MAG: PGPGW domain-containing protein [Deltaproteobacteria bacterium]|nr:PGPGW domain-containing protein [Deltaproteobacteria bacterium]MBW1960768.1 PGPGW domain-containing protein [Deltaproteobacteria bacterium]MBW1993446.1 PGPGW domain-containing protein [Deltaproteobacteria bacterium]MBW2154673.1 PGPGW domain-containing protein [Deltaproteobacteria bacterium]
MVKTVKQARKLIIGLIGFTVLSIGIAMIVLPGPAFVVIPIGLGILSIEFTWAKKFLKKVKSRLNNKNMTSDKSKEIR